MYPMVLRSLALAVSSFVPAFAAQMFDVTLPINTPPAGITGFLSLQLAPGNSGLITATVSNFVPQANVGLEFTRQGPVTGGIGTSLVFTADPLSLDPAALVAYEFLIPTTLSFRVSFDGPGLASFGSVATIFSLTLFDDQGNAVEVNDPNTGSTASFTLGQGPITQIPAEIPEPATVLLCAAGLAVSAGAARHRRAGEGNSAMPPTPRRDR